MSSTKLNPKRSPVTVQQVAAKHNLTLELSANENVQFRKEPMQLLYEIVVSTLFGKDTYYQTSNTLVENMIGELKKVVEMNQLDFVANLAIHARTDMNIRTMPIVLVVQFAKALREQNKSYPNMRRLVRDVIQRADQITDLYAYSLAVFGDKKAVPMAIKRGVADAFNNFGEYHFAKYNRDRSIKFRDVLRIVHPVAKSQGQGIIFEKIMKDTLETPYTWEVELSKNGQLPISEQKPKAQLWTELVNSGKMGYMATLRNMRNMLDVGVDKSTKSKVASLLSDEQQVMRSKQLPFDFVEAYQIVKKLDSKLTSAVSRAIDISCSNVPKMGDNIWIIIDYSGSMGSDQSPAINNATLLAASLIKSSNMVDELAVTVFGSDAKTLHGLDTNNSVIGIQQNLLQHRKGSIAGSTNFRAALLEHSKLGFEPDTIVVFTDGEVNSFPYNLLSNISRRNDVIKLTVNLNATPSTPMILVNGWFTVAGWSPAIFKWIPLIREKTTVVDKLSVPYMGR